MSFPAISALLPHGPAITLISDVLDWSPGSITCTALIHPSLPLSDPKRGLPAEAGIELLAQTCGAFAGLEAHNLGHPVRIGYLLGTRHYRAQRPWFSQGSLLIITASLLIRDGALASFDATIADAGETIASARLSVYHPD